MRYFVSNETGTGTRERDINKQRRWPAVGDRKEAACAWRSDGSSDEQLAVAAGEQSREIDRKCTFNCNT